jgi:uncharacterized protein YjiS (DUF1127 family)
MTCLLARHLAGHLRHPLAGRPYRALLGLLRTWHHRRRQRFKLAEMDDRLLRDIGITRYDAVAEYEKPFWKV